MSVANPINKSFYTDERVEAKPIRCRLLILTIILSLVNGYHWVFLYAILNEFVMCYDLPNYLEFLIKHLPGIVYTLMLPISFKLIKEKDIKTVNKQLINEDSLDNYFYYYRSWGSMY